VGLKKLTLSFVLATLLASVPALGLANSDFVVYGVYNGLNMGNEGEVTQKDFYINMGQRHGLKSGVVLNVYRQISTYDVISKKLYRDITFPIAKVKVIHVEDKAAVARLDQLLPLESTPAQIPRSIMVGDIVRLN